MSVHGINLKQKTSTPPRRAKTRLLPGLLALVSWLALGAFTACSPTEEFLLGGIQVNEDSRERWTDRLQAVGMNTVAVTHYAHQGDWDSYNLWFDGDFSGVVGEIRAAHDAGLRVVLVLRLALDHAFPANEFMWHGMIQPADEEQLAEWFYRYRSFVLAWAEVAREEGVELLMIGSELNALTSTVPLEELPPLEEYYLDEEKRREGRDRLLGYADTLDEEHLEQPYQEGFDDLERYLDARIAAERRWAERTAPDLAAMNRRRALLEGYWRGLAAAVREVYPGPIGYAANFDQFQEVGFWDALDVMGINAYFQLRRHLMPGASPEELYPHLLAGWRRVLADVAEVRARQGLEEQPVVFTELGYTWRANSTLEPWASSGFSVLPVAPPGMPPGGPPEDVPVEPVEERLVVWAEQPPRPLERALAVRALHQAHGELEEPFLEGILYWKLSSHPWHRDDEPFVLLIDEDSEDPLLPELRRFLD